MSNGPNLPELYLKCMEELRDRVKLVRSVLSRQITTTRDTFDAELIFLQLRKVLELIAFASLTVNKEQYAAVHARFAEHWKAKQLLQTVEKINPDFYPKPLGPLQVQPDGVKHFPQATDPFLTREDFELLYDKSSDVLHVRNPFSERDPTIRIKYHVTEWVSRIQILVGRHVTHLIDGSVWVVEIPEHGPVHLWSGAPQP